ncbi:MAG TPA: hypothetical protein VG500_15810 [Gemmatimonadales bacterium]|jgi:hypothetical protein|nr:hypothetical protein [Gemmatimonadales bacterium]
MRGRGPLSVGCHLKRLAGPLLVALALVFALGVAAGLAPRVAPQSPWELRRTTEPRRTGVFRNPSLGESSGVAASRRQPGVLWTLNDSGHDPWLFATDTLGRDLGAFVVSEAENRDWEAVTIGPCGDGGDCLYIADTGDNGQNRRSATVYRVPEPAIPARSPQTRRAEALELRYPNGRWDVEAVYVDSTGALYLITKGRGTPPILYRVGPESWKERGTVTAEEVGRLPIDSGSLGNRVTDAALSPSGRWVAVRTYLAIYRFTPAGRSLVATGVACDAAGLQLQGEGISWLDDRVLVLTSEGGFGARGTIVLLECGDPRLDP